MNDQEISKALALAIGWKLEQIAAEDDGSIWCCFEIATLTRAAIWRRFEYDDPAIIWPIAKAYNCFPYMIRSAMDYGRWNVLNAGRDHIEDTPEKAVAMAVIGMSK